MKSVIVLCQIRFDFKTKTKNKVVRQCHRSLQSFNLSLNRLKNQTFSNKFNNNFLFFLRFVFRNLWRNISCNSCKCSSNICNNKFVELREYKKFNFQFQFIFVITILGCDDSVVDAKRAVECSSQQYRCQLILTVIVIIAATAAK